MRFSVLIPVYNTKVYLDKCMQSVLTQSFQDYEVILVDDGSTDGSGAICDTYANEKVKVIHKENQGLLMARRTGIDCASGEFCIFLDSDDALIDGALENINQKLIETRSDILIYNTEYVYNDDFLNPEPRKAVFSKDCVFEGDGGKRLVYEQLLFNNQLNNLWLKAIRTPLVKQDNTDYSELMDNSMGEDLLQSFYPITHAKRIAYTQECYYYYRQNILSMTHVVDVDRLEKRFATFNPNILRMRTYYAQQWGMWNKETMYAIYRRSLRHVRELFNSVFFCYKDSQVRKKWCAFPWETLLPAEVMEKYNHRQMRLTVIERIELNGIFKHSYILLELFSVMRFLRNILGGRN